MVIDLHPEFSQFSFNEMMQLQGEVYRKLEGRCTQRIMLNNRAYFIKCHHGVGWKEIFKNLIQGRLPIVSAKNEYQAIKRLKMLGIAAPEVVGFGCRGVNPASMESFLVTRELPNFITLEDLGKKWQTEPPAFRLKKALITQVAHIAKTIHENGINHRDFYLCHFLLDLIEYPNTLKINLIDLHRAQIRKKIPARWVIKDLAGLYFSSIDIGLTQRDKWRFMKAYRGQSLRDMLNKELGLWQKVKARGDKLYQQHQ